GQGSVREGHGRPVGRAHRPAAGPPGLPAVPAEPRDKLPLLRVQADVPAVAGRKGALPCGGCARPDRGSGGPNMTSHRMAGTGPGASSGRTACPAEVRIVMGADPTPDQWRAISMPLQPYVVVAG